MTTTWGAPATVAAPAAVPVKYTLLDAAVVIDDPSGHWQMGYQYEPLTCGVSWPAANMCSPMGMSPVGDESASVNTARQVSLTLDSSPPGTYFIDWGDGGTSSYTIPSIPATHTYAAPGNYTITVTGEHGYTLSIPITVTTGAATGPFTATASVRTEKQTDDGAPTAVGYPFAAYNLQMCRTVGRYNEAEDRARRSLEATEYMTVEMMTERFIKNDPDFFDATPPAQAAAGMDIGDGLALLEYQLSGWTGGQPTIIMQRDVALALATRGALVQKGNRLETVLGTPVAAVSTQMIGPAGGEATTGQSWMYGVANLVLRRGGMEVHKALDARQNEYSALAERPWAVSWECVAAGVKVKGGACCPTAPAVSADPTSGDTPFPVQSGTDSLTGPTTWTAPALGGILRNVTITVLQGTAKINGSDVTAPTTLNFDADTGEALTPPTLELESAADEAVVSWVEAMP